MDLVSICCVAVDWVDKIGGCGRRHLESITTQLMTNAV